MWIFRMGLWGVWIGWCIDWLVRHICFRIRARGDKWLAHSVL